jgi:hypothetical protein
MSRAIYFNLQRTGADWDNFNQNLQRAIRRERKQFPWLTEDKAIWRSPNVFELLESFDEEAYEAGAQVWLLLDEAELLIGLGQKSSANLQIFRSVIGEMRATQIVFASAKELTELDSFTSLAWRSSPFLHNFPPPIYIGGLDNEAATALICQTQSDTPLCVADEVSEVICRYTNNHPYLMQWVCYHLWEKKPNPAEWRADDVICEVSLDLQRVFKYDFDYLSDPERQIMRAVLLQQPTPAAHRLYMDGLIALGYLRRVEARYEIGNDFFKYWLLDLDSQTWIVSSKIAAEPTLRLYQKEPNMSDPYSITWALMVTEKATEFLFGQAGEMLKEWREKRKKTGETPTTSPTEPAAELPINALPELQTALSEQLKGLERQASLATSRMQVERVESLLAQLEDQRRNKLLYEEEAAKLPSLDDRVAIRRRIEDLDVQIAHKTNEMRQVLEQLSQRKIHIPALDE